MRIIRRGLQWSIVDRARLIVTPRSSPGRGAAQETRVCGSLWVPVNYSWNVVVERGEGTALSPCPARNAELVRRGFPPGTDVARVLGKGVGGGGYSLSIMESMERLEDPQNVGTNPVCERRTRYAPEGCRVDLEHGARSSFPMAPQRSTQRGVLVACLDKPNKRRHACFSKQYAAVSTIALSSTPAPRSANTTGGALFNKISSRHF